MPLQKLHRNPAELDSLNLYATLGAGLRDSRRLDDPERVQEFVSRVHDGGCSNRVHNLALCIEVICTERLRLRLLRDAFASGPTEINAERSGRVACSFDGTVDG